MPGDKWARHLELSHLLSHSLSRLLKPFIYSLFFIRRDKETEETWICQVADSFVYSHWVDFSCLMHFQTSHAPEFRLCFMHLDEETFRRPLIVLYFKHLQKLVSRC